MIESNILLIGSGYWGKNWYKTLLTQGVKFSVVEPTLTDSTDINGIVIYTNINKVSVSDFTHVIICTPANTHVELYTFLTKNGMQGQNILIEKPCGKSHNDVELLSECYPGFLQLHTSAFQYILNNLGRIGTPVLYKSIRASMGPRVRTDVSIIEDYLIHDLYIFLGLFYPNVDTSVVSKTEMQRLSTNTDTIFLTLYNTKSHIIANMFSSWWYPLKERKVIINGTLGSFIWDGDDLYFNDSRYESGIGYDKFGNLENHLITSETIKINLPTTSPLENELKNFLAGRLQKTSNKILKLTWNLIRDIQNYE